MTFAVLRVTIRLADHVPDPYLLFRVRDGFQGVFQQAVDCLGGECGRCARAEECPCRIVFAQVLSPDPAAVKRHQKPPLPFAFSFPVFPDPPNAGLYFEVRLTLVGMATRCVREFVDAVRLLFDKHTKKNELSAVVERVESLGYHDEPTLIYSEGSPRENADSLNLLTAEGLRDARLLDNAPAMRLRLVTPLKLMQEGRTMRHFSFSPFIRTLIRRASSLASYYCDDGIPADYRWLTSLSEAVRVSKCTIRWVEWGGSQGGGKLAGLAGEAILTSMPEEFIPFLLLGELFNVGKGAPFGLGRFTVAAEEP